MILTRKEKLYCVLWIAIVWVTLFMLASMARAGSVTDRYIYWGVCYPGYVYQVGIQQPSGYISPIFKGFPEGTCWRVGKPIVDLFEAGKIYWRCSYIDRPSGPWEQLEAGPPGRGSAEGVCGE